MRWKKVLTGMVWFRLLCWGGLGIDQIIEVLKPQNAGWFHGFFYFLIMVIIVLILVDVITIYALNRMEDRFTRKVVVFSSFVSLLCSIAALYVYSLTLDQMRSVDILRLSLLFAILLLTVITQAYVDRKKLGLTKKTQQFADPADIIFEKAKLKKSEDDNTQNS